MNRQQLVERVDDLEERIAWLEKQLEQFEHATLEMVDEKINEATSGLATLEDVVNKYDLY